MNIGDKFFIHGRDPHGKELYQLCYLGNYKAMVFSTEDGNRWIDEPIAVRFDTLGVSEKDLLAYLNTNRLPYEQITIEVI